MIDKSLRALTALRYPHDTWLLDEGDDAEAKALCERLGVRHFSRKGHAAYHASSGQYESGSKHGNYNSWLDHTGYKSYEYLIAFDPDHLPHPNFADEVLGYFTEPAVGYVQAPQAYYNHPASWIAAGAAEETYDFNSTLQMAAQAGGHPLIIGCHNSHRLSALREAGGYAAHDADDLLLTARYRSLGWRGVFVPQILARGLTPVDWSSYLTQQRRWARSLLHLKLRPPVQLSGQAGIWPRLTAAFHGLGYLQPAVVFTAVLAVLLVSLADGSIPLAILAVQPAKAALLAAALLACFLFRQSFYLDPATERGLHWRAGILRFAKAPFLLLALIDVIFERRKGYVMTEKVGRRQTHALAFPFLTVSGLIALAWVLGNRSGGAYPSQLHAAAAVSLGACLLLAAFCLLRYPDPFDPALAEAWISSGRAH